MALQEMLQNLGGFQSLAANAQRMQQQEQQQLANREASDLLRTFYKSQQAGNPDYNSLNEAILRSPELSQNVLSGIGLQDKQRQQAAASDVVTLYQSLNDPQAFGRAMATRINGILQRGGDPSDSLALTKIYNEQGPDAARRAIQQVGAAMVNQGLIKSELVGFGGGSEPMSAYQQASVSLRQQELDFQKEQKRNELKEKALQAQLAKEKDELERQKIQAQIDETKQKIASNEQKKVEIEKQKENSNMMLSEAYGVAKDILNAPNLDDVVGTIGLIAPTVRGESQDLINKALRLQSLLTVDNLKMMSGVLTDKDIAFLTNVASGLNVTDSGIRGSTAGVKKRLEEIVNKIGSAAKAKGVDLSAYQSDQSELEKQHPVNVGGYTVVEVQ